MKELNILITGGAGFIGGNLIRKILLSTNFNIINIDNLGYASDIESINNFRDSNKRHFLHKLDLKNYTKVLEVVNKSRPDLIIHLAAESHVDRSLDNPFAFVESNIIGTFNILQASLDYYSNLSASKKKFFRFIHVSTDEVFGSLEENGKFNEKTRYDPRSPYSASKASSDHLVRAWHNSYNLPILITNCSNNYGPYQFPEKLIPLSIIKALNGELIPIYGSGKNIRDWIHVDDHVNGILEVALKGNIGETYCIGGNCEKTNLELVQIICTILDQKVPMEKPYSDLIGFVKDRPGHDLRYSINTNFIKNELGWTPKKNIYDGLTETVEWYLDNKDWTSRMQKKSGYKGERLGKI